MIKLKSILPFLGYTIAGISALYGLYSFIFNIGFKTANKENSNTELVKSVNELKTDMKEVKGSFIVLDFKQDSIIGIVTLQAKGQTKLVNSVTSLALKVAATPLEFARIMEGKEFELVQSEEIKSVFPETTIKIKPIKK